MPLAPPRIILASTSRYRRDLLERLHLPFEAIPPHVDETAEHGETPSETAARLALSKARAVAGQAPDSLIIGSDQVAHDAGRIYGKPGSRDGAIRQLRELSGRSVVFDTALCLYNARTGKGEVEVIPTEARFRSLSDEEILRYVDAEQPFDCAGSAKSEGLGIALLDYMRGDDPTALVGLPLIALSRMLRAQGIAVP